MSWFGKKKSSAAVATAPDQGYVAEVKPPEGFVPLTRPEGATDLDLRDLYIGTLVSPDKSCTTCWGSGFEPNADGRTVYCHCRRADDTTRAYSQRGQEIKARETSEAMARKAARS